MIKNSSRTLRLLVSVAGVAAALTACATGSSEGIGFREARYSEMSAIQGWRSCRDEALELDRQARDGASPARYLASAQLLEKCESDVGAGSAKVTADERLRAYALSTQNYLKGGDIGKSRETLDKLKQIFPNSDLYFANGASFIDTMEFLTGIRDKTTVGVVGISNVDDEFRSELRRAQYWKRN
jgi:hypothetical protein